MNLKSALLLGGFLGLLSAVTFQLYRLSNLPLKNEIIASNTIPVFEFESLDGMPFTNVDLPLSNKPIVFMYMDTGCPDCIEMTRKILKHYAEFKNVYLFMVTESDKGQVDIFIKEFEIKKYPNIQILFDKSETILKSFKLFSTPSFVIYSADLKMVKVIDDTFNFSIVVKYVREANKKSSKNIF